MGHFEYALTQRLDERIRTLGTIKTRSIGADTLTLTAFRVLVYAQLEGGVKEFVSLVIKHINAKSLQVGELAPHLLQWRNPDYLSKFRAAVNFYTVSLTFPFANLPAKKIKITPLNRRRELNQMGWENLQQVYLGLGLNQTSVKQSAAAIDELVQARNLAAHHGNVPDLERGLLETQVRDEVNIVENVLIDFALQLLPFFSSHMHRR